MSCEKISYEAKKVRQKMDIIKILEAEQLKGKLSSYPKEIYELRRKKQEVALRNNLEFASINIENEVYSFFQGKRSNQEQRKLKFIELARKDKNYNEITAKLKDLEKQKNLIEIEIERLYNEFKATREQTKILVAELNLIGGGEDENNRNRESWFTF